MRVVNVASSFFFTKNTAKQRMENPQMNKYSLLQRAMVKSSLLHWIKSNTLESRAKGIWKNPTPKSVKNVASKQNSLDKILFTTADLNSLFCYESLCLKTPQG